MAVVNMQQESMLNRCVSPTFLCLKKLNKNEGKRYDEEYCCFGQRVELGK